MMAVHSGLNERFIKDKAFIVEAFKRHVRLLGTDVGLKSSSDVKYYFANFMREGSVTCKRVAVELDREKQRRWEENPYRFEELIDGCRTYCGNVIPPDAPPRPSRESVWDERRLYWR